MIDQKILDALKDKDCFKLLALLSTGLNLPDDLGLIDDNTGKTLQELIRESSINFSIPYPTEYFWGEMHVTPIQSIFINLQKGTVPNLRHLKLILLLGANVNQVIDNEGNTVLHHLMLEDTHPLALMELIKSGGDIYQKNNQGQTPLDLADETTSKYLLELNNKYNVELKSLIKIQRQFRSMKKLQPQSVELSHVGLPLFTQKPVRSNPPDEVKTRLWVERHKEEDRETAKKVVQSIQHISFDRFLFGLKMAVEQFNSYLHSLPEDRRKYVLLIDSRTDKSGPWVTKLAQQFLAFSPETIVSSKELETFNPSNDMNHLVFFDDASYSGNLLYKTQDFFYTTFLVQNRKVMNLQFHLIVPFTTERARKRFKEFPTLLYTQEVIPSFTVKGTFFQGETATYFDHKIPVDLSTIECLGNGKLITGEDSGISFIEPVTPPYKLSVNLN